MLVVAALAAGTLATEGAYRIARRVVCIGTPGARLWIPHPEWGWMHRPYGSAWLYGCDGRDFEWRAWTVINATGLRDRPRTYEKSPGMRRVLVLGDSTTEAVQVPMEATFTRLLEEALGSGVEVINAGIQGFGTDNQLLYYRSEGHRYRPDVVLLVFNTHNDVLENAPLLYRRAYAGSPAGPAPKPQFALADDGSLRERPARVTDDTKPLLVRAWKTLERHLYVARALRRAVTAAEVGAPPPYPAIFDVYRTPVPPAWEEAWLLTERLLLALRDTVEATGARFVVAVMPAKETVNPELWNGYAMLFPALRTGTWELDQPRRRILDFLARVEISHVDLLPPLAAHAVRTGRTGFYRVDIHLAADGHRVVAAALADVLRQALAAGGNAATGALAVRHWPGATPPERRLCPRRHGVDGLSTGDPEI